MERRTFLKNTLGIAIVSALPISIFENIVKKTTDSELQSGEICFLHDKNDVLIAKSLNINLGFQQRVIQTDFDYIPGLKSWSIKLRGITMFDDSRIEQIIKTSEILKILILKEGKKVYGDVYITEFSKYFNTISCEGSGALIIE